MLNLSKYNRVKNSAKAGVLNVDRTKGRIFPWTDRQTDRQTEHSLHIKRLQAISAEITDNAYDLMKHFDKHDESDPCWISACRARDLSIRLKRAIEELPH